MENDKYTFLDLAYEVLSQSDVPLTVREIWDFAVKNKMTDKINSVGKTPINTLNARLATEVIKNNNAKFIRTDERPTKYSIKDKVLTNNETTNIMENNLNNTEKSKPKFKERDLHILLSSFVISDPHFKCYTKTIFHEKSVKCKKGKNEWLHPDIVGVYYPFSDYKSETLKLYTVTDNNPYKIFSFEMKIKLDYQTLREYYFQAVSNSSWANEGYLVALDIDDDVDFLEELKRLNNSFGIGVIKLNPDNISQSEILLMAKENKSLDFSTIDRLVTDNSDFKEFVSDISLDTQDDDPRLRGKYDKCYYSDEETRDYCLRKGITTY